MKKLLLFLASCSLAFAQFDSSPKDPRWRTVGAGALAARPSTCVAKRDVYLCTGSGCAAGGVIHYCSATNTWDVQGGGGGGGAPTGAAGGVLSGTYPNPGMAAGAAVANIGFTPENSANRNAASGYAPLDGSSLVPLANIPAALTGKNAATATALASAPTNCSAGSYTLGVNASGNSVGCTALATIATSGTIASASDYAASVTSPLALKAPLANANMTSVYLSGALRGNIKLIPLLTPAAPGLTVVGASGGALYGYKVVAKMADGTTSQSSLEILDGSGNATLNGTNYYAVSTPAVANSTSCDVYRTTLLANTSPTTLGKIGNVTCGSTLNDTGLAGDGTITPLANFTGAINDPFRSSMLRSLGRDPRLLVLSDSILNQDVLAVDLQVQYPGAVIVSKTYSSSQGSLFLVEAAGDVQAYTSTGNLLPNTDITSWTKSGITTTATTSPVTRAPVVKLASTVASNIQSGGVVVPASCPDLTFSFDLEAGATLQGVNVQATKAGSLIKNGAMHTDAASSWWDNGLPNRFYFHIKSTDGVTFTTADTIVFAFQTGVFGGASGNVYVGRPMVNCGGIPAPFSATTGTAQSAASFAWVNTDIARRRELYDAVVMVEERNSSGHASLSDFDRTIDGVFSGLSSFCKRILYATPPPLAAANRLTWNTADPIFSLGYFTTMQRAAARRNVGFYDAVSDFKSLVSQGTYTILQLMADTTHPSTTSGLQRYTDQIVSWINTAPDIPVASGGPVPAFRVGGVPGGASQVWAYTEYTSTTRPYSNAHSDITGNTSLNQVSAYSSGHAGDTLTFTCPGQTLALVFLADASSGIVTVTIDGSVSVTYPTLDTSNAGFDHAPRAYQIASDLTPGNHTVVVTVSSGTAHIVGVVGV